MDEFGWLYLETPLGLGLVHTQDMVLAVVAVDSGQWAVEEIQRSDLSVIYGYVTSPVSLHAQKKPV